MLYKKQRQLLRLWLTVVALFLKRRYHQLHHEPWTTTSTAEDFRVKSPLPLAVILHHHQQHTGSPTCLTAATISCFTSKALNRYLTSGTTQNPINSSLLLFNKKRTHTHTHIYIYINRVIPLHLRQSWLTSEKRPYSAC